MNKKHREYTETLSLRNVLVRANHRYNDHIPFVSTYFDPELNNCPYD